MPQLLDLSNELLLEIIGFVTPEGIEQFSLCSKHIYHLAKDALKAHRHRKNKYRVVKCASFPDDEDGPTEPIHPLQFLAEIGSDKWVAEFTTELILRNVTMKGNLPPLQNAPTLKTSKFKSGPKWYWQDIKGT